jgi:hypothetical protein
MKHGGKRLGAGRPKGSRNRASARREQFVALSGRTPIEVMIAVMRYNFDAAEYERSQPTPNQKEITAAYARALDAAHKAAQFVHPRLSAVEHGPRFDWSLLTLEEVNLVEPILRKALDHGVGGTVNGEAAAVIHYTKDSA